VVTTDYHQRRMVLAEPGEGDGMRQGDILVLPSIQEGYGSVIADAMASGCVPLASEACTEICRQMETGLMHRLGDVPLFQSTLRRSTKLAHFWRGHARER
jgi:hypothetical protein